MLRYLKVLTYARGPKAESGVCAASSQVGMDDASGWEEGVSRR
jgi:hypothetical protein